MTTHKGGCHCGRVTFEVQGSADIQADECNCSICRMSGYLHMIVSKNDFKLVSGKESLTTYRFNSEVAEHYFCRYCGIKSYYVPRSHPDGISVNTNCLVRDTIDSLTVTPFDGQDWEKNVHKLSPIND